MNYVSRINSDFEKSDFKSISNDHFKCLLFVCGLRNARYTDVRSRVLKRIEEKQEISLQIWVMNVPDWQLSLVTPT